MPNSIFTLPRPTVSRITVKGWAMTKFDLDRLGRIALEEWLGEPDPTIPSWDELPNNVRQTWRAVAKAVLAGVDINIIDGK